MRIARVVGAVVSTVKDPALVGSKLLVVEVPPVDGQGPGQQLVAVDAVGAGRDELVLVVTGGAARLVKGSEGLPIDAAVIGIVDHVEEPAGGAEVGRS